jgi:mono/diheme cytochrome c family protein
VRIIAAALGLVLTMSACSASPPESEFQAFGLGVENAPPAPELDLSRVTAGQSTYLQNCATCHQPNLSGTDDWKIRDENGRPKPPPLDSAGHAWHHSDSLLIEVVTDGSFDPEPNMKGFTDRLSDSEIADVIEFLKSTWGTQRNDPSSGLRRGRRHSSSRASVARSSGPAHGYLDIGEILQHVRIKRHPG